MKSTDTRPPYALTPAQRAIVQRAAWGLLRVDYESYTPGTESDLVRAYSREVNVRITGIKGERRGAVRRDSVDKLIREGILSRPFRASVVRVTEAGRAALEGRPAPEPVAVPEPAPVKVETAPESEPTPEPVKTAAQWNGLPERKEEQTSGHEPRRTPFESDDVREAFTSEDGGLSFSLFRIPDDCTSPEIRAKHEKTRTAMAKHVAKRDKGKPEWKPFGKGQIQLKPRTAPKQIKTPADVLKAWSGEVIHEYACDYCGEFECTCVRDTVSAVLANNGGPVVDADAVARGRKQISGQTENAVRHECADQIAMGEDVPVAEEIAETPEPSTPWERHAALVGPLPFSPEQQITELEPGYERVIQWGQEYRMRTERGRVVEVYHAGWGPDHACDVTRDHALNTVIHCGAFAQVARAAVLLGLHEETQVRCDSCEPGWQWGRGKKPKARVRIGQHEAAVCLGGFHSSFAGIIPGAYTDGLSPDMEQTACVEYAAWVGGTGPEPVTAAERLEAKGKRKTTSKGGETMGRRGLAPKRKAAEPKVGDIEFSDKKSFPCVAELHGHRYVVRKLAGSFSALHEHADGAHLIFEGEDKKGVCRTGGDMFPNLPAVKRAILADAVARGEGQPVVEEQPEPEECDECEGACECWTPETDETSPVLGAAESEAVKRFPELAQFLEPRGNDAPMLVLNLFSGPGGAVVGLRDVLRQELGRDVEIINVDNDADCVKTLKAAGFLAIQADVTSLDPADPVFREVRGVIVTPPCTDYTDSGKRAGLLPENIEILEEGFDLARRVAGFMPFGDMGESPEFGKEISHKAPNGESWAHVRAEMGEYSGATGHLMLEVAVWSLGLQAAGAPLEWVAVEQSSKLPKELRGEIAADFQLSGWGMAEWAVADAADYGSPTQRVRALLVARRDGDSGVSMEAPGLRTGAASATGLPEGTEVFTRGVGKRSGGGNVVVVSDAKPYTAFTSRIRSVDVAEKGGRFTIRQILSLITMPHDYPVQGSRTSVCQQIGDVVAPVVAAALLGAALGIEWVPRLMAYLAEQYPQAHGADAGENLDVPAGESVEVQEQENEPADTESAEEWSYENERDPRPGCGSFPEPCRHAWPCGRDEVAWRKAQAKERAEKAAATPGAKLTEGENVTYAGASDDGYGHHFERMAYDWQIAEGRFRTKSNDLGDKHRFHGESPKGNNGWTISVRCLHATCKGRVFTSVDYDAEAVLAMRAHGRKKHPQPTPAAAPKPGEPGFMAALLEKHVGPDWTPIEATADPAFPDVEEEQPQYQGPLTREQRRAAWRIAAGEPSPVLEAAPVRAELTAGQRTPIATPYQPPARTFATPYQAPQPDHDRAYWEPGQRVTLNGRAGVTRYSTFDGVRVVWDDAPNGTDYVSPRLLWVEGTEPKPYVKPDFYADDDYLIAPAAPKRPAHYDDDDYVIAPPVVDPIAELRREIARERADFERWSAELDAVLGEAGALVVAEAMRVVREAERQLAEMEQAESAVLERMARGAMGVPVTVPLAPGQGRRGPYARSSSKTSNGSRCRSRPGAGGRRPGRSRRAGECSGRRPGRSRSTRSGPRGSRAVRPTRRRLRYPAAQG
ncbi:hypothetical protein [Streptomyces sp. NPDC047974]|uniref:hypothetical protein n=1 Tax=Streptomyces sp. NPDC047974 TaxID=3154343 RepID=UPI0033FB8EB6